MLYAWRFRAGTAGEDRRVTNPTQAARLHHKELAGHDAGGLAALVRLHLHLIDFSVESLGKNCAVSQGSIQLDGLLIFGDGAGVAFMSM